MTVFNQVKKCHQNMNLVWPATVLLQASINFNCNGTIQMLVIELNEFKESRIYH